MAKRLFREALKRKRALRLEAAATRHLQAIRRQRIANKRETRQGTGKAVREEAKGRKKKIFETLKAGKSHSEIKRLLRISDSTFAKHLAGIRAGFKGKRLPPFIPPKGAREWSYEKGKRVASFIEFAKDVTSGKKAHRAKPASLGRPPFLGEKGRKIDAMLAANPKRQDKEIADALSVSKVTVAKRRRQMVGRELIPETKAERLKLVNRRPERVTGVLNKRERNQVLEQYREKIEDRSAKLYRKNKKAFDSLEMGPKAIEKEVTERLDWALQTFDPKEIAGKDKVKAFVNRRLAQILYDVRRISLRTARQKPKPEKKAKKKKKITVAKLEKESKRLGLDLAQEAVFFGLEAKLPDRRIGNGIGITASMVNWIKLDIERKKKALSKKRSK